MSINLLKKRFEVFLMLLMSTLIVSKSDFLRVDVFKMFLFVEIMNLLIFLSPDSLSFVEKFYLFLSELLFRMDSFFLVIMSLLFQDFELLDCATLFLFSFSLIIVKALRILFLERKKLLMLDTQRH
jgi:hypothetical protein